LGLCANLIQQDGSTMSNFNAKGNLAA